MEESCALEVLVVQERAVNLIQFFSFFPNFSDHSFLLSLFVSSCPVLWSCEVSVSSSSIDFCVRFSSELQWEPCGCGLWRSSALVPLSRSVLQRAPAATTVPALSPLSSRLLPYIGASSLSVCLSEVIPSTYFLELTQLHGSSFSK